jgi:hypothetical protein
VSAFISYGEVFEMAEKLGERAEQAVASTTPVPGAKAATLAIDAGIAHWFAWNIAMDAGNIAVNARQAMEAAGVTIQSVSGSFMWGEGLQHQAATFFAQITTAGPESFLALTVADTSQAEADSLRDKIKDDLKARLGIG